MGLLKKVIEQKSQLEATLNVMPITDAFFKLFIAGNLILGVTSGMLIRFFWLALKYTDYKFLNLFYAIRFFMYSWLVFYAAFSIILLLQREKELPKRMLTAIFGYIAVSILCLIFYESFMPFQLLGSHIYDFFFHAFMFK